MDNKEISDTRAKVKTSVRLTLTQYRDLETLRNRLGVPHTVMIRRGIEMAIREYASELKNPGVSGV